MAAIGFAALTLSSCGSTAPSRQVQTSTNNEEELRTIVANDRQQIDALQQQLARENDRITELEHNSGPGGGNQSVAPPAGTAAPPASPSGSPSPAAEVTPAPGTSPAGAAAASPEAATNAPAAEPDSEPSAAPTSNAEAPATPAAAPTALAAAEPPPPATAPSASEAAAAPTWQAAVANELAAPPKDAAAKLYRAGLAAMKDGNYKDAAAKFDDLQRRYPKSDLSGPAEYFAGNARYEMGQYEKAILQFNDLGSRFPEGRYTSAALLREADAFTKINDPIDARLTLQKLVNEHPNAPEVAQAKAMMDSLSSQSAGN